MSEKELEMSYLQHGKQGCNNCLDDDHYCNDCTKKILEHVHSDQKEKNCINCGVTAIEFSCCRTCADGAGWYPPK